MELFGFIKVLFTDPKTYQNIKNSEKGKHFFMTNRFFAIKWPSTAHQLNRVGITGWAVVDLWSIVARRFSRVPGWIYTKVNRTKSDKIVVPDSDAARLWMTSNNLTERDLKDAIHFYPKEMKKTLKSIENQMNMYDTKR